MERGKLRKEILEECPEDFEETLGCWISDIEGLLDSALDDFDISDVSDLHRIEDARRAVENIKDGLY